MVVRDRKQHDWQKRANPSVVSYKKSTQVTIAFFIFTVHAALNGRISIIFMSESFKLKKEPVFNIRLETEDEIRNWKANLWKYRKNTGKI